jgi:tetratricopeptide (TPR) repeat protein
VLTGDVVALVRVIADLDRLATLAPSMAALAQIAHGHLALMRERTDEAIAIYERNLDSDMVKASAFYPLDRALHVRALSLRGDHLAARELAVELLQHVTQYNYDSDLVFRVVRHELAMVEARLGNATQAFELLDACLERAQRHHNPLACGSAHRDRARIALMIGERDKFIAELLHMEMQFRATDNPWLIQQCEKLRAEAARAKLGEDPAADIIRTHAPSEGEADLETALEPIARERVSGSG